MAWSVWFGTITTNRRGKSKRPEAENCCRKKNTFWVTKRRKMVLCWSRHVQPIHTVVLWFCVFLEENLKTQNFSNSEEKGGLYRAGSKTSFNNISSEFSIVC